MRYKWDNAVRNTQILLKFLVEYLYKTGKQLERRVNAGSSSSNKTGG